MSKMASKLMQTERFVKIIHQQLQILNEERNNVIDSVDYQNTQVQSEVNAWINGGNINQATYIVMNNRIQEIITLFIEKSAELSGQQINENESNVNQTFLPTTNNFASPEVNSKIDETKTDHLLGSYETAHKLGAAIDSDDSHNMTMRFAILEEAVYSLKKTTEKVEDKIENVDKILKDVSTQQVNDHKKVEILTNAKLKSEKKLTIKITDLEKRYQDIKSNNDDLFETVTNVDGKLNRLEEENNSVNVSMNELNKQISSVRTCSNDTLMSIQDLSKSVESTNQHYNEMSYKMNQLEISLNLISTQCTEQLENTSNHNQDKADDLIGLVCQLLAKRLTPLEKLNETLNKKVNSGDKQVSEKDAIEIRIAEMSNKITEIELKCTLPNVGFLARKQYFHSEGLGAITLYGQVMNNHGDHFHPSIGIFTVPLNGLYLITIMTESSSNSKTNKINCYRIHKDTYGPTFHHHVSMNQTATRCAEIEAGDKLYLTWGTIDEHDKTTIGVTFSCYLIHKL